MPPLHGGGVSAAVPDVKFGRPITPFYGAILAIWYLVLTLRVIVFRRQNGIGLGDGRNNGMKRRIRAHGNFSEYVPLTLILIYPLEISGAPFFGNPVTIHTLLLLLLLGRLGHGYSLSFTEYNAIGRVGGMALTLLSLLLAAVFNIVIVLWKL
mmetsp:Transcript_11080/g.27229  ORF Transcript_11080/g.27229 Transcript_11080/m.27229 type:complete len:153 (-) Transcript_11080:237-695(-)